MPGWSSVGGGCARGCGMLSREAGAAPAAAACQAALQLPAALWCPAGCSLWSNTPCPLSRLQAWRLWKRASLRWPPPWARRPVAAVPAARQRGSGLSGLQRCNRGVRPGSRVSALGCGVKRQGHVKAEHARQVSGRKASRHGSQKEKAGAGAAADARHRLCVARCSSQGVHQASFQCAALRCPLPSRWRLQTGSAEWPCHACHALCPGQERLCTGGQRNSGAACNSHASRQRARGNRAVGRL